MKNLTRKNNSWFHDKCFEKIPIVKTEVFPKIEKPPIVKTEVFPKIEKPPKVIRQTIKIDSKATYPQMAFQEVY